MAFCVDPRPTLRAVGLFGLAVATAACWGPSLDEAVAEHGPPIEAKLAVWPKIREKVATMPRLEADEVRHEGPPLVLEWSSVRLPVGNAAFVHAEDLEVPDELGYVYARLEKSDVMSDCASILRRGNRVFDPAKPTSYVSIPLAFLAIDHFEACEAVQTLLVVRTVELTRPSAPLVVASGFVPEPGRCRPSASASAAPLPPAVASAAPAGTLPVGTHHAFEGGRIRAEVLVFDADDGAYEGGFRVEASSAARIYGGDADHDLRSRLREAVAKGLERWVPGTQLRGRIGEAP
jgi:hypothetical protein